MKKTFAKEDLNDMISPKMRKRIKKILGKSTDNPADNIVLRESGWVKRKSSHLVSEFYPKAPHQITSNIKALEPFAAVSMAKDFFINQCVESGKYTFDLPLVIMNPYGCTPLTALACFQTKKPRRIRCTVPSKEGAKDVVTVTELKTAHRVPVLGLYPGETNTVILELLTEDMTVENTLTFPLKAPKLPTCLRGILHVKKHTKDSVSPLILVNGGTTDYPYAFDENGDIRYVLLQNTKTYGLYLMSDGKFLQQSRTVEEPSFSNPHSVLSNEMDYLGRVYKSYYVPHGTHHDVKEMTPGGNFLAAYSTLNNSLEDAVAEIDRTTGNVVKMVDVGALLDEVTHPSTDWVHINAVSYDTKRDTVLLCSRNLHSVIQLNWKTGDVDWVLGHPDFWKGTNIADKLLTFSEPDMPWFFQPHSAYFLPEDLDGNPDTRHMIIFDNHWQKRTPVPFFDEERKESYVKFYCINDKERTVSFVKEFETLKTPIRAIGHYLHDSRRVFVMGAYLEVTTQDGCDGMVYEYDYDTGELYNQYGMFHSYFRAYPFQPDLTTACMPMDYDNLDTELGTTLEPECISRPDFSHCEELPRFTPEERQARQEAKQAEKNADGPVRKMRDEMKKKIYKEQGLTNELTPEEFQEHLRIITFHRQGNYLHVRARDHFIQNFYFIGENNCYVRRYTNTTQRLPAVFGNNTYELGITTRTLKPDTYQIYLEISGKIYRTKFYVTISDSN